MDFDLALLDSKAGSLDDLARKIEFVVQFEDNLKFLKNMEIEFVSDAEEKSEYDQLMKNL